MNVSRMTTTAGRQRQRNLWISFLVIICCSTPLLAQTPAPPANSPVLMIPSATPSSIPSTMSSPSDLSFPTTTANSSSPTQSMSSNLPSLPPTKDDLAEDEDDGDGDGDGDFEEVPDVSPPPITTAAPATTGAASPTVPPTPMPTVNIVVTFPPTMSPTELPSSLPSMPPSPRPSQAPTASPSATPTTMSPSASPSAPTNGLVMVESIVPIELRVTNSLLIGMAEESFLSATQEFLTDELPELTSVAVSIARQYRKRDDEERRILQDNTSAKSLFVDLGVSGFLQQEDPSYDLEGILVNIFETKGDEYIFALKSTGDTYFQPVQEVAVNIPSQSPAPVVAPSPTTAPIVSPTNGAGGGGGDEDDSLTEFPLGAIIGIAVGGFIVLALVAWLVKGQTSSSPRPSTKGSSKPSTPLALADDKASDNDAIPQRESDLESQALYSYVQGDNSVIGGSSMQNDSIMGMDTMSYAYSLEPGLETGTLDGSQPPIVPSEIPQFNPNRQESDALNSYVLSTRDSEFDTEPTLDGASLAAEDLKLTDSELAMLPSDLAKDSSEADKEDQPTRKVIAPPGKLGIVIDTTVEGPVVHYVNENSALIGKIWAGDIIVAIDDVDTRAMSASAITELMVKTANQKRVLTVASGSKE